MQLQRLATQLTEDESESLRVYKCPAGYLTIGVGRNLEDVGISPEESDFLLQNDIKRVEGELDQALPWWCGMNDVRQEVLANMCFNLGLTRLLGFKKALAAMEKADYATAAAEMKDSKWYSDVGKRAERLCRQMESGVY